MTLLIISAVVGYLLGSANSSLIAGLFYGTDVRKHGSGNAGATNTLRTLGKKAALFVSLGDMLKGVLAYLAGYYLAGGPLGGMIGGTAAVLGHILPVFFRFKGGKGVMTSLAVLLMIDWKIALILLGLFIIIVLLTRYVSLGSVSCAVLFPVLAVILGRDTVTIIFSAIIAILIVVKHRSNILRLVGGTESKLGSKKKQEADNAQ